MTPMGTNYGEQNGEMSFLHINYYEQRAKGGTCLLYTSFIQLVKIMINDTRIVDVNTSSPFHIAITKITAAASNPITDIAAVSYTHLFHAFLQFCCKLFLTVWMSPLTVRQTLDHIPVPILFLREGLVRPEES